jgi:hypothetical protein
VHPLYTRFTNIFGTSNSEAIMRLNASARPPSTARPLPAPPMTLRPRPPAAIHNQVRKTPSWPRSWASFSLLLLYSHGNAWASWRLLGQPNTCLAPAAGALRTLAVREVWSPWSLAIGSKFIVMRPCIFHHSLVIIHTKQAGRRQNGFKPPTVIRSDGRPLVVQPRVSSQHSKTRGVTPGTFPVDWDAPCSTVDWDSRVSTLYSCLAARTERRSGEEADEAESTASSVAVGGTAISTRNDSNHSNTTDSNLLTVMSYYCQ